MASAFGQFIVMIEKCVAAEPPQATYVYKKSAGSVSLPFLRFKASGIAVTS